MQGSSVPDRELLDAMAVCGHLLVEGSVHAFLAEHGTMQIELLNRKRWDTRLELSTAMVDWIEGFYNRRRRHSSLGYISPNEYERRNQQPKAA